MSAKIVSAAELGLGGGVLGLGVWVGVENGGWRVGVVEGVEDGGGGWSVEGVGGGAGGSRWRVWGGEVEGVGGVCRRGGGMAGGEVEEGR